MVALSKKYITFLFFKFDFSYKDNKKYIKSSFFNVGLNIYHPKIPSTDITAINVATHALINQLIKLSV